MTFKIKNIFSDIRFWIIIFFLIRLIGITNPPLETSHNWRQSLTNMVARNFQENGNLFYPRIDMAGEKSGIIGSEFPIFNYIIYTFSSIFGYTHWYGRLINLLISSIGIFFFYKLIRNLLTHKIAFNATFILLTSIWFSFSRKIMPDTFSVSLVIIGLYYGHLFLKEGCKPHLLLFFSLCTIGMLCKIPALSLFSTIAIILFIKKVGFQRKIALFSTAFISFSIICLWYFYWVPHLLKLYKYQLYFPKGIIEGIKEIIPLIPEMLEKFYFSSLSSYLSFICFIGGIIFIFKSENVFLKLGLGTVTFVFVFFIIKTGSVFPLHNYYIIPFTPIMAIVAGYSINKTPLKYQYILLGFIAIEGIGNQQHDFFLKKEQTYKLTLEKRADQFIPKNDLIIINGNQSPQDIYFSNRKGWTLDNETLKKSMIMDSLVNIGAKYLIIDKSTTDISSKKYNLISSDEFYDIYQLK